MQKHEGEAANFLISDKDVPEELNALFLGPFERLDQGGQGLKYSMKKYAGIWIDHEKAFIVSIENGEEKNRRIESNVEGHIRLSGGSRSVTPYGPQEVASEKKIDERRKHHLRQYYQEVIRVIADARKILIIGPGEAKVELEKEIKKSKEFSSKIAGVEPADKMTKKQIAAKTRQFFVRDERA